MKPGMQRDLLVVYSMLFEEFEIWSGDPAKTDTGDSADLTSRPNRSEPGKAPANAVKRRGES